MFRSSIKKKLTSVSAEMASLREELGIVDEQLQQTVDEAEDLRLRAMVSETPLAEQEHREAAKAVTAVKRDQDAKVRRLKKLEQKQDDLLDRLGSG